MCRCGGKPKRVPKLRWYPLTDGSFRVVFKDSPWILTPTPIAKYPWIFGNGDGSGQEIGMRDAASAQLMAEFVLDVSTLLPPTTL